MLVNFWVVGSELPFCQGCCVEILNKGGVVESFNLYIQISNIAVIHIYQICIHTVILRYSSGLSPSTGDCNLKIAIFFRNYVSTRTITLYVPEDVGDWWASRLLIYDQVFLDLLFLLGPHNVLFQPSGNCKVIGTHRHWRHHPLLKVRWLIAMSCWINIALSLSLLALSC